MRALLAVVVLAIVACASTGESLDYETVFAGKTLLSAKSEQECLAKRGSWRDMSGAVAAPTGTFYTCIIPTTDAGNSCSSAADCQSMCVLRPGQDVSYGDPAAGQCMADYFTGGCKHYVHKGRYALGHCSE